MTKGRRILVTGATGFLGSHLARRLLGAGWDVVAAKRRTSPLARIQDLIGRVELVDIDTVQTESLFAGGRIDAVLHCATDYGRKEVSPPKIIEANLVLPLRLLEAASSSGAKVFVNTDTILDKRVSHYSLSKRQFADWLAVYSSKLAGINVALEHFYGPGDDPTKFVSRIVADIVGGAERIALTPGEQQRDFVYIDDVADAFMLLIERAEALGPGFHRYEVGSGRNISIKEFAGLAARLAGNRSTRLDFGAVAYRDNEVMESRVDIGALQALGWRPRVSLEEGLKRMIEAEREKAR